MISSLRAHILGAWSLVGLATFALMTAQVPTASATDSGPADDVEIDNAADLWDQEGAEWPRWSAHDESSTVVIDYSAWTRFIKDFGEPGSDPMALDYVHVANKGMGYLRALSNALQRVEVSKLKRDEQLAFWLNLHNVAAVWRTAVSLPLEDDSTRAIIMGAPWREKTLEVEGEKLSLVDIARRIVIRQWKDPRVLYGLCLPANGAPGLPPVPFAGATVWKAIDGRARKFVNSDRALEFHSEQLHVSALYFWDRWLFPDEKAVIAHLRAFAAPPLKAKLANTDKVTATFLNWRVNSFNSSYDPSQDRRTGS